jgi:hypothetical protein
MHEKDIRGEAAASATDEFFKQQPVWTDGLEVADSPISPLSPLQEVLAPSIEPEATRPSALQDYVRELQREYQEQEREGKI